jgi:hypothetical protein
MHKVGDIIKVNIIKVKQNTYKLSKETISKLKEEYGHCLSERQLMEIREEQDDKGIPFQKEDLVLFAESEAEVFLYNYSDLLKTYRGYCNGKHIVPIYEKEHFQGLKVSEVGKEWDEVWFRTDWFINE